LAARLHLHNDCLDAKMKDWIHWLPGIATVRRYEAAWLPHDLFAGVVLATMLVPVGIAYAAASGLPGISIGLAIAIAEFLWAGWRP
jgi:MFS superfamily sulfate permease-like transporter